MCFNSLRDKPGIIYVELKTDGADSSSDLVRAVADAIVTIRLSRIASWSVSFDLQAVAEIKVAEFFYSDGRIIRAAAST